MARTSKAKAQSRKEVSPGPLRRSFDKKKAASPKTKGASSSNGKKGAEAMVTRGDNAAFLSYLRSAMKVKCANTAQQALALHEKYRSMDANEKKSLICEFFKAGGKRQGLSCMFSQHVESSQIAGDKEWSGYVTPEGLMELFSVSLLCLCL